MPPPPTTALRRAALVVVATLLLVAATSDPLVDRQWHLGHTGTFDAWRTTQAAGVVVAVVDTGVDASHPDLDGQVLDGIDYVDPDTPADDPNGHGTLVAGIIAAVADNGEGVAGAAPRAQVLPVRVLNARGRGKSSHMAEGIRWAADNGADVINLSLAEADPDGGARQNTDSDEIVTTAVEEAIAYAAAEGVVIIAAAGNDGRDGTPYEASSPAIVVGATDASDGRWEHSNHDERTLYAPGVQIASTWRDAGYALGDGTSFAAPVVAAGAAMLVATGADPPAVRQRLLGTTVDTGFGLGRVDLAAAVDAGRPARAVPEVASGDDGEIAAEQDPAASPSPVPLPTPESEPGTDEADNDVAAPPVEEDPPDDIVLEPPIVAAPPLTVSTEPSWPVPLAAGLLAANLLALGLVARKRGFGGH